MARVFRNKIVLGAVFLALIAAFHAQAPENNAVEAIKGIWVIKSIYRTQNIQGPSPAEQRSLIGTEIVYGARSIESCGQSAPISAIDEHRVSADDFLANTRVRFAEVQIDAPSVIELVLNRREAGKCFGAFPLPGQDVYLKNKHELLICFEGVFYRVVRKS